MKAVAKILNMNETLAGVTLLAFGNGAPDVLTSFGQTDAHSGKLFTELVAGAFFVGW